MSKRRRSLAPVSAAFADLPPSLAGVWPDAADITIHDHLSVEDQNDDDPTLGVFLTDEESLALARSLARVRGPEATPRELVALLRSAAAARMNAQFIVWVAEGLADAAVEDGKVKIRWRRTVPDVH